MRRRHSDDYARSGRASLASWGERFAAWTVDMLIVGILPILIFSLLGIAFHSSDFLGAPTRKLGSRPPSLFFPFPVSFPFLFMPIVTMFKSLTVGLVSTAAYFLYWTITDGVFGKSLGKWIFGLKVTKLTGEKVGVRAAAVESLGKSLLLILDVVVGLLIPEARNKRQRLTNYLSRTVVVRTKPPSEIELRLRVPKE